MRAVPAGAVELRPARPEDSRRVWLWRNDEETRQASFDTAPIPFEVHERWFQRSLSSPARRLYIARASGLDAGVLRLDLAGREATVSIHLGAEWRRRGVGTAALQALAELAFGPLRLTRLVARIKADNAVSLAAFARAGFEPAGSGGEVVTLERRSEGPVTRARWRDGG